MEFDYFSRVTLGIVGIVGLWVHIFIEGEVISGVGVGLTHTVSKTLVCTFLCVGGSRNILRCVE